MVIIPYRANFSADGASAAHTGLRSISSDTRSVVFFGTLHRNELSGTLTGLTRVRRFQQVSGAGAGEGGGGAKKRKNRKRKRS